MASSSIENKTRQSIPILYKDPDDLTQLKLVVLRDRERVVMDDEVLSQDILDKESAGYLLKAVSTETPDSRFDYT